MSMATSTSDNAQAATSSSTSHPAAISIPDGRRNSQGEHLHSPTETWKPTFQRQRTQSWSQEDFKHVQYVEGAAVGVGIGVGETVGGLKGGVVDWKRKEEWGFSEAIRE